MNVNAYVFKWKAYVHTCAHVNTHACNMKLKNEAKREFTMFNIFDDEKGKKDL